MDDDKKRTLAERLYNANVLTDASLKSTELIDVVIENIKENGSQSVDESSIDVNSTDEESSIKNEEQ